MANLRTPVYRAIARVLVIGGGLLLIGVAWLKPERTVRLTKDEERRALTPLLQMQVPGGSRGLVEFTDPRWQRIRAVWGEPELVVSFGDAGRRIARCLPGLPLSIAVVRRDGNSVPLTVGGPPYGYSSQCESCCFRFRWNSSEPLEVMVAPTRAVNTSVSDLIVVADWNNVKDKIVGAAIDEKVEPLLRWASIAGLVCLLCGVVLGAAGKLKHAPQRYDRNDGPSGND
jgi:hypothetical protein